MAFIALGVLAGPGALVLASSTQFIETLSQFSIAVLLFLVGLKRDVNLVRSLGKVAVATGLGQVGFSALFGFLIARALGIDWLTALHVGVTLTSSSTIIIVKLLSDRQEIRALHGKIALGLLIVQDIFVVLAMVTLSAVTEASTATRDRLAIAPDQAEAGPPDEGRAGSAGVAIRPFCPLATVAPIARQGSGDRGASWRDPAAAKR